MFTGPPYRRGNPACFDSFYNPPRFRLCSCACVECAARPQSACSQGAVCSYIHMRSSKRGLCVRDACSYSSWGLRQHIQPIPAHVRHDWKQVRERGGFAGGRELAGQMPSHELLGDAARRSMNRRRRRDPKSLGSHVDGRFVTRGFGAVASKRAD